MMISQLSGLFASCTPAARPLANRRLTSIFLVLFCLVDIGKALADNQQAQPPLPVVELQIKNKLLTAEVAATGQQRYMGLSFRQTMDNDAGMLFVFEEERALTFTMRNTLIPLSIAFISSDLVINEIHDMNVGPNQLFPSRHKAQFALEVNQGWFEANGIKPGDRIENFTPLR